MVSVVIIYFTCVYFSECYKDTPFIPICYKCSYLTSFFFGKFLGFKFQTFVLMSTKICCLTSAQGFLAVHCEAWRNIDWVKLHILQETESFLNCQLCAVGVVKYLDTIVWESNLFVSFCTYVSCCRENDHNWYFSPVSYWNLCIVPDQAPGYSSRMCHFSYSWKIVHWRGCKITWWITAHTPNSSQRWFGSWCWMNWMWIVCIMRWIDWNV